MRLACVSLALILYLGMQHVACLRMGIHYSELDHPGELLSPEITWEQNYLSTLAKGNRFSGYSLEPPEVCFSNLPSEHTCSKNLKSDTKQSLFNEASSECDWSEMKGEWETSEGHKAWVPADGCPKLEKEDFHRPAWQKRQYYFFGNSVTRHYALAFSNLLKGKNTDNVDRKIEKKQCQRQVLGTSSCDFSDKVHFRWKNTMSAYMPLDDKSRDACWGYEDMDACLRDQFKGATKDDILVIGSNLGNQSYMQEIHGDTWASLAETGITWLECALHNDNAALMDKLQNVFPGLIIWHSYPALDASRNGQPVSYDVNACYRKLAEVTRCAIGSGAQHPRMKFIDFFHVQSTAFDMYHDCIHHPGSLSIEILLLIFGMVPEK